MRIKEIRDLLDSSKLTVRGLADSYITKIDKYDDAINAYLYVNKDVASVGAAAMGAAAVGAAAAVWASAGGAAATGAAEGAAAAGAAAIGAVATGASDSGATAVDKAQSLIDAGLQGPLTGIPIALADNICTRNMPTTCASKILDGYRPPYDATVVERLRAQNVVFMGKLNLDEFSMGTESQNSYYGPVSNPYDTGRVAGGASGGAAAAVAAGMCAGALGVDTGGAILRPSALCGVTGFRPTYGMVSRHGCVAYASPFDQVGVVAADAAGCAQLFDAITGPCSFDSTTSVNEQLHSHLDDCSAAAPGEGAAPAASGEEAAHAAPVEGAAPAAPIERAVSAASGEGAAPAAAASKTQCVRGLRVGVITELFGEEISADVRSAIGNVIKWFENAGASVSEVSIPMLRHSVAAFYVIACAEASANLARFDGIRYGRRAQVLGDYFDIVSQSRGEGFGAEVKRQILFGMHALSSKNYERYYMCAVAVVKAIRAQYEEALQNCDVLLSPASLTAAYCADTDAPGRDMACRADTDASGRHAADACTVGPSLAGLPAVTTPCGYTTVGATCDEGTTGAVAATGSDVSDATIAADGTLPSVDTLLPAVTAPCGYTTVGGTQLPMGTLPSVDTLLPVGSTRPSVGGTQLPVGMLLTGRRRDDRFLLEIAAAFESEFTRRPPVMAGEINAEIP